VFLILICGCVFSEWWLRRKWGDRLRTVLFAIVVLLAAHVSARADAYVVTVAGLGGEPDYQTRFDGEAADLDKIFQGFGALESMFIRLSRQGRHEGETDVYALQQRCDCPRRPVG